MKEASQIPVRDMKRGASGLMGNLLHEWGTLYLKDGLLYRKMSQRSQFVLPDQYRVMVLKYLHDDMGHIGAESVLSLIRERFYRPYMKQDIDAYVTRRCPCKRKKSLSPMSDHSWGLLPPALPSNLCLSTTFTWSLVKGGLSIYWWS